MAKARIGKRALRGSHRTAAQKAADRMRRKSCSGRKRSSQGKTKSGHRRRHCKKGTRKSTRKSCGRKYRCVSK